MSFMAMRGWCVTLWFSLAGISLAAGEHVSPPVLCQMELQSDGYRFGPEDLCFLAPSDRGYFALYVSLTPDDARKGSRLVVWDVDSEAKAVLVDDLNAVCGAAVPVEGPGCRFRCVVTENEKNRGDVLLFGASGPGGGRLVRFDLKARSFTPLGRPLEGRGIVRLTRNGRKPLVALARSEDGKAFSLHVIGEDGLPGEAIASSGPRLAAYVHGDDGVLSYQSEEGTLVSVPLGLPTAAKSAPTNDLLLAITKGDVVALADNENAIGLRYYMQDRNACWFRPGTGELFGTGFPASRALAGLKGPLAQVVADVTEPLRVLGAKELETMPWRNGIVFRTSPDAAGSEHLYRFTPADGKVVDHGVLALADGKALRSVKRVVTDAAGHVMVLAEDDGRLKAVLYRNPCMDEILACINRAQDEHFADRKEAPGRLEVLGSLHAFGHEQDRGWDPYCRASDGNIYFGAMPHHATRSTRIWQYDTRQRRLKDLGAYDVLAGLNDRNRIPSMMHGFPVELDGTLYFIGQDPFYGNRGFPSLPPHVPYAGSTILACDLKSLRFRSLGVPLPGSSVHGILPAYTRGLLYLRENYDNAVWHSVDVKNGTTRKLDLPDLGKMQHVDGQGCLWFVDGASGEVRRFDPGKNASETRGKVTLADFPGVTWTNAAQRPFMEAQWLPETLGKEKAVGFMDWCEAAVELDTATGKLRCLGRLRPEVTHYPRSNTLEAFGAKSVSGDTFVAIRNRRGQVYRHIELYTLNMRTGNAVFQGILRDNTGRLGQEANCMAPGEPGCVYVGLTVHSKPGDLYFSHRMAWANRQFLDTIFTRLDLSKLIAP
jgi:hypothetical protein